MEGKDFCCWEFLGFCFCLNAFFHVLLNECLMFGEFF